MIEIPKVSGIDVAFGNIKHMPKYDEVPEEFRRHDNPYCKAISAWFFSGAEKAENGLQIGGDRFTAKPGVNANAALAAIRSILCSFEPKHEHKEAGCAYLLSEWFDRAAVSS